MSFKIRKDNEDFLNAYPFPIKYKPTIRSQIRDLKLQIEIAEKKINEYYRELEELERELKKEDLV